MISRYEVAERAKRSKLAISVAAAGLAVGLGFGIGAASKFEDASSLHQAADNIRDHGTMGADAPFAVGTLGATEVSDRESQAASYDSMADRSRTVGYALSAVASLSAIGGVMAAGAMMRRAGEQMVDEVSLSAQCWTNPYAGAPQDIVDQFPQSPPPELPPSA